MNKYRVSFLALSNSLSFEVTTPFDDGTIDEFIKDLIFIFSTIDEANHKILVEAYQQNTEQTRAKISLFVDKFKESHPKLNELNSFFKSLSDKEYFIFLPNTDLETIDKLKLFDYLRAVQEGKDFETIHKHTSDLFAELLNNYRVGAYGDIRLNIGEPKREKRVCRFCGEGGNTTFKKKAHAISEGLGNKTLVLFEECDKCNERYSQSIEPHIIQYLSLYRTFFEVQAKGGVKQWQGDNFKIKKEQDLNVSIFSKDEPPKESSLPYKIRLEGNEPLINQHIYRCLCKFFLSVIPTELLSKFQETINWINEETNPERLPKIGQMVSYHAFTKQPKLITYIRKNNDTSLPFAVGEFYFTCLIITFIVPFSSEDQIKFINPEEHAHFWETFQHYEKSKGWTFHDFSDNHEKKFIMNLNFNLKDE